MRILIYNEAVIEEVKILNYSALIGNELRAIRNRHNMSLKELQDKTGIYAQTLSEYENNKVKIKVCILEKILTYGYGIDLFYFFKAIYENTHISGSNKVVKWILVRKTKKTKTNIRKDFLWKK